MNGNILRGRAQRYFLEVVMPYDGDECLPWPLGKINGYGRVRLDGRGVLVTRAVCERVFGPPPTPEHEAAHSCGRGHEGCCAKRHLSWKTKAENEADKVQNGTSNRGERSAHAKLTNDQARLIKTLVGKQTDNSIAQQFNVSTSTIWEIRKGKRWRWLDQEVA